MPEKKVSVPLPDGKMGQGTEISIKQSVERWSDIELEDGSTIRLKPTVLSAIRIDGQYDQDGNPLYAVRSSNTMVVKSVPPHLLKGAAASTKLN